MATHPDDGTIDDGTNVDGAAAFNLQRNLFFCLQLHFPS